ncbi:MAG: hypothetical protein WBN02_14410 [Sedimenticolaceae bacterium]
MANLMPSDAFGYVTVPVWVGYGSGAPEMRESPPKPALEPSSTGLYDPQASAPGVYFVAFGDNLINFELRFFIQNIDYRISVRSDTLFTLDDAFREAGIEIPFPQRLVHLSADVARAGGTEKNEEPTLD